MIRQLKVQELSAMLAANEPVYLLDVRQPWEHDLAALPNSTLVPLDQLDGRAAEIQPTEYAMIVVYCHHGIRSLSGAALLQRLGHENVASLAGGIDAWSLHVDPKVPRY
jgi:adenylyltransferase/sulfurtransferase